MRLVVLVVAFSLLGIVATAGTASANVCTPHLVHGDVKGYVSCTEQQCQWDSFPYGAPVCTD